MAEPIISANLLLYILLGAVAGMIYSLKRILRLERVILEMEKRLMRKMGSKKKPAKKKAKKKKKR